MSEEEINEDLKSIIEYIDKNLSMYCDTEDRNAIQGLLDLYNKEKEKNKTLETLLQGNLYQMYSYYKELASRYQANSISKDKIKEIIEELEENNKRIKKLYKNGSCNLNQDYIENLAQISILKELLEE